LRFAVFPSPSAVCLALFCAFVSGCMVAPGASPPGVGLTEISERPAEKALLTGMRAYDEGVYASAEQLLLQALERGLASARDRAVAHKHLAFIYCTTNRMAACEASFRAARQDDPSFALSKSEANHPQWGAVYLRTR
jgi:Tfp pilus assembly protein PilF